MRSSILYTIVTATTLLAAYSVWQIQSYEKTIATLTERLENQEFGAADGEEHHELAEHMGSLQRYMNKLWFAGINENEALAAFYIHEIEENMEEIVEGNIMDDGKDISVLMKSMALPALEQLDEVIDQRDFAAFQNEYLTLVNACNSCHQVTEHAFIRITQPETPAFTNQVYTIE